MITLKRCWKQCVNDSCKLLQQRKLVSGGNYGFIPTHISTSRHVNCIQWAWHPRLCGFQTEGKETGNYNNNQNFSFHTLFKSILLCFLCAWRERENKRAIISKKCRLVCSVRSLLLLSSGNSLNASRVPSIWIVSQFPIASMLDYRVGSTESPFMPGVRLQNFTFKTYF